MIVEKKASGAPLIYELRSMGVPVQEYTPSRGQDKIARLNSVSDIIASGKVWVPRTRWAEELVDEIAAFPSGEHDDLVDATTLALMRFRQGGFLRLPLMSQRIFGISEALVKSAITQCKDLAWPQVESTRVYMQRLLASKRP